MRRRRRQTARTVAEERQHFVAHDPDDLLRRRQALQDFLVDRLIPHAVDERLDDLEVDVRLEQRHPDLPERGFNRLLGETDLTTQRSEDALEAVTERVEHWFQPKTDEPVAGGAFRRSTALRNVLTVSGANVYRNRAAPD